MLLPFTKMHGLGNDFMVVDCLSRDVSLSVAQIRSLSHRMEGIGFDQLLFVEPPVERGVDFNYRIFNADGNEVEQCGNGARCLARFVIDNKLTAKDRITVSTCNALMEIEKVGDGYQVNMGEPRFSPSDLPFTSDSESDYYSIEYQGRALEFGICSVGNPHAVIAVDNVDTAAVETEGPFLEAHPRFPQQVNVGFMQIVDRSQLRLRVFERGVGETRACGTGACAAAAVARRFDLIDETVQVELPGGQLRIDWAGPGEALHMTGPAATVFEGKVKI